jgi:hypothetical protein
VNPYRYLLNADISDMLAAEPSDISEETDGTTEDVGGAAEDVAAVFTQWWSTGS